MCVWAGRSNWGLDYRELICAAWVDIEYVCVFTDGSPICRQRAAGSPRCLWMPPNTKSYVAMKHYEIFCVCDYVSQCISCVAQDNSSSNVAQRCQKVAHPCKKLMSTGWREVFSSELTWPVPSLCAHFNLFAIMKYFYELLWWLIKGIFLRDMDKRKASKLVCF